MLTVIMNTTPTPNKKRALKLHKKEKTIETCLGCHDFGTCIPSRMLQCWQCYDALYTALVEDDVARPHEVYASTERPNSSSSRQI